MNKSRDTIAAIATGMTNSGIGIVRISGNEAFHIADCIFKGKDILSESKSHTIHYGLIVDEGDILDEVLVSVMRAPRTFTGEDTIEINCHGGVFVIKRVLEAVLKNGARTAEPGEFTKRAFLNGKMDLSQAEAVGDLIASKNEYALRNSVRQLKGSIRKKIEKIREEIIYHTAFIESALDDPEHIDLDGYGEKLKYNVEKIMEELDHLIQSSDNGRMWKEGINTVILGKPNVGKSSLLNVLSGKNRAIVTEIEGTTRDVLEEQIQINGLSLNVMDTAGIRDVEDVVEQIGVEKAKEYAKEADLLIYVIDASRDLDENDEQISKMIYQKKCIILLNKSDLDTVLDKNDIREYLKEKFDDISVIDIPIVDISAKMEQGLSDFEHVLQEMFFQGELSYNDEIYITNIRQKEALKNAYKSLERVLESIRMGMPEDFYSIDLMDAYESLGNITGEKIGEDLVHEIFSKFCMGK